ncbi:MAG: exodeoxyribonuclease V subunit gamma [Nocardioidaceae bacterium]|nr:exodeoxyribonuclease V subunit gamma [Nocardioidaceae bacterium]
MTGLHLHRAERADVLVEALADVLRVAQDDPFAPELVAVPARGIERWLTQRLAHHLGTGTVAGDGVCANIDFPAPPELVAAVVAAGSGVPLEDDPWAPPRLVWSVLGVLHECVAEPWCGVLARHLDGGGGTARHMVTAQHLAALFTSYAEQRPAMLCEWAGGADTDGAGAAIATDLRWQVTLWRRLRARVGTSSPAERVRAACAALRDDPALADLPQRLSLFGCTRLTRSQVAVVAALAAHRAVHLWLPHPSSVGWDRAVPPSAAGDGDHPRRRRDSAAPVRHQLLSSLGRDAREMQVLLTETLGAAITSDQHHPLTARRATTLLGRLQHDLRADVAPPGTPLPASTDPRPVLDPGDRSVQVHACHGRARQVEVLREVLLGLLAADVSLEPRDVLVMCPDIETYAPLVSATFGLAPADDLMAAPTVVHPGHGLRVRLADRSLRQTNPLLAMLARLLELADGRVTASQVLDLMALPSVRRRFGLADDDLERIREWVRTGGVRWGLDAAHRAPFTMQGVTQNTWEAGLDRVLLGVSMAEDPGDPRWVGLALPMDDVDSGDIDLAGRLAELLDRLDDVLSALTGTQPLASWLATLSKAVDTLSTVGAADAWQLAQVRRQLAEVESAGGQPGMPMLALGDVRALLADRLAGRPTRANFRTGNLTMCSMVPMRSVPHRVVCLLGLDDGVFPRTAGVDGDDVLARDPLVGERDRRSEDRQLLLDAVLAAQEHLVVVYNGADERTNAPRPPAVPLGEILDVVDATIRTDHGQPAREQVVVRHPLQPFDARNFRAGALGADRPFSFDRAALAGAKAAGRPREAARSFLPRPLAAPEPAHSLDLEALTAFLEHPVRGFLRQRLGVTAADGDDELDDALHAELTGLDTWAIGDRWVRARLAGADEQTCTQAEWRRGALPPGALGGRVLTAVRAIAEPILAAGVDDRVGPAHSVDVAVPLSGGRLLSGTVGSLHGGVLARTVYSTLAGKHRLRAWVQLLALTAARPDEQWRAATVGRAGKRARRSMLTAPSPAVAGDILAGLADLRAAGLCEPLPLPVDTSHTFADRRHLRESPADALDAAARVWDSREAADSYHRFIWGDAYPFSALIAAPAAPDEQPSGDGEAESSRFAALALRLWAPLLAAEETA